MGRGPDAGVSPRARRSISASASSSALLIVVIETRLRSTEVTDLLGALIGGAIGLGLSKTIGAALFWADASDPRVVFLHSFILLVFPYLGIVMGARKGEWLEPQRLVSLFRDTGPQKRYRILDTSVIIDGRIADVCETGFLDGTLVIPQFVLKELQLVADSADSLKRNRGRRGLDILQKIQKMSGVDVTISDIDFPEVREVDLKLIELGRTLQGKIVTNDFNLNKVAQLRGVEVLNINELANALKPVVLPGEFMKVFILKEGKEYNQGVAYLDDGTMVVVDNARRMISKNIDIVVTSVLQTTAGKMIFGRYIEAPGASPAPMPAPAQRPGARHAECEMKPWHWWRTVFFLIPAVSVYTIVLGTASLVSSLFDRRGDFGHKCARAWSWLILKTTGVHGRRSTGLERLDPSRSYIFVANHQSIYDIPILFASLPVPAADPVEGLARADSRSWAGTCGGRGTSCVDRSKSGAGIMKKMARLVRAAALADRVSRGHAQHRRPGGAVQGRLVPDRASRPGLPVVPISIQGSRHVMFRGRLMVCPGHVTVTVHEPIETAGVPRDAVREFSVRVHDVVASAAA